jgi:Sulfotransferase family
MYKRTPSKREQRRRRKRHKATGAPKEGIRKVPSVTFVGGTGRSGTHVVSRLLSSHGKLHLIPVECRFHVEERGFPGLLAGTVTKRDFLKRLRGFWWRGFQTNRMRGMYRFVPRERFDRAVSQFDDAFDANPELACRDLFWDLLWPAEAEGEVSGLVEQSCDTIAQAGLLRRLFADSAFVHVVRDGRDSSASRVSQTKGLIYPRTRRQGLEWWERRLRAMDAGARALGGEGLTEVSLDELLADPSDEALAELFAVANLSPGRRVRGFLSNRMSLGEANAERWTRSISGAKRARLDALYADALDRLESDGVSAVPLLRRTYERRLSAGEAAAGHS